MPYDPTDMPPYYTTDDVDDMMAAQNAATAELELRVSALEQGEPAPPNPGPEHGVDLAVTVIGNIADSAQGTPVALVADVENIGDTPVEAGTIIGVGFLVDGVAVTWASTDAGLAADASIELGTDTAQWSGGPWIPATAGEVELTAFVDDTNRIPELDEDNNRDTITVDVAEGSTPAPGGAALFAASSLWNTAKHPTVFADGADAKLRSLSYGLNNGPYSHPITRSTANDPIHTFDMPNTWGWPAQTVHANMRDDASPASGTDGHLCLLNADGRSFDMWILRSVGTRHWRCEAWAQHNWINGSGFGQPQFGPSAGVTVCGAPTAAGTVTAAEVEAGVIPHALCMAFSYNDQGGVGTSWQPHVAPAIANDVGGGPGPICEGALLVATGGEPAGLNAAERALFNAAKTFGVYVVDKLDGVPTFYGDRSSQVGNAFRGDKLTAIGRTLRMVKTW